MFDERRMAIMNEVHDIMSAEENQATPKEAFGFLAPLTSKRPMKSDK